MMERGGLVLRVLALLMWMVWLGSPVLYHLACPDLKTPYVFWFGLMVGTFFVSALAWPVERKKAHDDRDNGSGY